VIAPEDAVEAINERFGRHPGRRALHAKGSFYRAVFNATVDASRLTRAAHMQAQTVDATLRFSNGAGDPSQPDNVADARGMAVTFHLPGGSRTDISAQSVPRFPFSTPEAFIEFVRASDRSVGSLWRLSCSSGPAHTRSRRSGAQPRASAEPRPRRADCRVGRARSLTWPCRSSD
jgi:catalase